MQLFALPVLLAAVLAATSAAQAEDVARQNLAARRELHPIPTLTLPDRAFLIGDAAAGTPVTIAGELRIAQGTGRLPVVILQHGSGGIAANIEAWSRALNAMGVSAFALDGFTGRGLVEVNSNQALLGRLNLILDIYRALDVLAKHPRVDPARIALMGFSRGGQAALYAGLARFQRTWNHSGLHFAAYLPFYPDCMTRYVADTETDGAPIRIFAGTADDFNPAAVCGAYVARLRAAGRDAAMTLYAGAAHAFDNPLGANPPAVAPTSESVRSCRIEERADGLLVNVATDQPFSYRDACVEHGPHLGYDPAATQQAQVAVTDYLRVLFQVP